MSSLYDLRSESRISRSIDHRYDRNNRKLLPYLPPVKQHHSMPKPSKKRRHSNNNNNKSRMETHVRRYEENEAITVLSIRFASADITQENENNDEEAYIKAQKNKLTLEIEEKDEEEDNGMLPFLKYKRYESPEQQLRSMGYDPDVRVGTEVYSDKVEEKKERYLNKMQALKRDLETTSPDHRQARVNRCNIRVKILGEEIKRKRERELLRSEEKKGKKLLESLLKTAE